MSTRPQFKTFGIYRVGYAYPTSEHAKSLGCYMVGCWFVANDLNEIEAGPYKTEAEADAKAHSINCQK